MRIFREAMRWVFSIAVSFILALFVCTYIIQPTKVSGHSMEPTLHDTERLFILKWTHTFSMTPNYGDIVVIDSRIDRNRTFSDEFLDNPFFNFLTHNDEHEIFFIKRVIGKPGDTLEIRDHHVYRNGQLLKEPYIKETMLDLSEQTFVVPKDHIFVMGDNRNHSKDSRDIGFIPLSHVLGKKL
ncbi:signal peptidase I [Paenibacillus sp. GCM10027629]|uniref:signal peptidase I n=1 Tax=Paenibacillus sp. GCM10027629 TaxID=3273414 RepID=UPI003626F67E